MRPEDVQGALDALASEQPAPTGNAATVIARGHRHVVQRRVGPLHDFVLLANHRAQQRL